MQCNLKHTLFYFWMILILIGCSPTGKQLHHTNAYPSGQSFNTNNPDCQVDDSMIIKPPIGFSGMNEEKMIFEVEAEFKGKSKTVSPGFQKIKPIQGVGIDSVAYTKEPVTDPLLIAGICIIGTAPFLAAFAGIIITGLLTYAGIGLIIASIIRINNHPEKYKGKQAATTLLIIFGILSILGIIVSLLLSNLIQDMI